MMNQQQFDIGRHQIGAEFPPFVIAEAGVHHRNDVELAKSYIRQAHAAGAHAIKFQTYSAKRLAAKWAPTYWASKDASTQFDIFATRSLLSMGEYAELCQFSAELGILFLSTPFDPEAATMLNDLGMVAFKIASADLTNVPLLQTVAGFGKPVLLSTGAATFEEVRWAFDLMTGADLPVALLHCTLSYPTHLRDANLQRITALRDAFPHTIIGYSDHTQPQDSELACPLAVALGARIIEKHYTLDKSLSEDDHYHAVDTAGLTRLVTNCRDAEQLTSNYREITASEQPARQFARRSIVAARALKQGTRLTELDLDCKRPGTGLAPIQMPQLLGKILNRDLAEDELLALEFVE